MNYTFEHKLSHQRQKPSMVKIIDRRGRDLAVLQISEGVPLKNIVLNYLETKEGLPGGSLSHLSLEGIRKKAELLRWKPVLLPNRKEEITVVLKD